MSVHQMQQTISYIRLNSITMHEVSRNCVAWRPSLLFISNSCRQPILSSARVLFKLLRSGQHPGDKKVWWHWSPPWIEIVSFTARKQCLATVDRHKCRLHEYFCMSTPYTRNTIVFSASTSKSAHEYSWFRHWRPLHMWERGLSRYRLTDVRGKDLQLLTSPFVLLFFDFYFRRTANYNFVTCPLLRLRLL